MPSIMQPFRKFLILLFILFATAHYSAEVKISSLSPQVSIISLDNESYDALAIEHTSLSAMINAIINKLRIFKPRIVHIDISPTNDIQAMTRSPDNAAGELKLTTNFSFIQSSKKENFSENAKNLREKFFAFPFPQPTCLGKNETGVFFPPAETVDHMAAVVPDSHNNDNQITIAHILDDRVIMGAAYRLLTMHLEDFGKALALSENCMKLIIMDTKIPPKIDSFKLIAKGSGKYLKIPLEVKDVHKQTAKDLMSGTAIIQSGSIVLIEVTARNLGRKIITSEGTYSSTQMLAYEIQTLWNLIPRTYVNKK